MVKPPQKKRKLPTNVKLALDFAPLLVFFIAFKLGGVMVATVALMVTTTLSIGFIYSVERKLALAPLISGALVGILGGLSLWLKDEQFIKMKPTLVYLLFATILLIGDGILRKELLRHVLGVAFQLTARGWWLLSCRWGGYFLSLALLNEYIWRHYSTETWVNFKVFGLFGGTLLFALCQLPLLERYKQESSAE